MLDALVPFGAPVWRITETLINKAQDSLFGPSDASRSTRVLIFNHSRWPLYFLGASFESGGFTPGQNPPGMIEAKSVGGYRVESHGFATGVAGAVVQYGYRPTDQYPCLWIVTSNPFAGGNSWNGQGYNGLVVKFSGSVGNANQVEYDVWEAAPS